MLLSAFGTSSANVGLPSMAQSFSASFAEVQWIVLAYLLTLTALVVGAGRLGDLVGRRRLLVGGLALFIVASVLCGLAPTLWVLVAARAVQGIGAAVMMALTMAFVGDTVPREKTGRAMGLLATMSAVGTALGPSLGGILIAATGWRAIFFVNVPLGLLALLLVRRFLPADHPERAARISGFDFPGTLLLALALGAYALAVTVGRGRFGILNFALLLGAAGGATLFALAQGKSRSPLVRLSLVRDGLLATSLMTSGLVATVMMATLVVGPFYLSRALGLDPARVGLVLAVGPVVAALVGAPAGRLADRYGAERMTLAGLGGIAAGSLILFLLPTSLGVLGYLLPIAAITAGYGMFQTANNTAIMTGVRADERGVVSGLLHLSRNLGLITGASVMGAVFAHAAGPGDLADASAQSVAAGMRVTFGVAAILVAGAMALAVGTTRIPRVGLAEMTLP